MTPRKWRPGIGLIVFSILLTAMALPLVGLFFFRIYENQLVRQTEAELIAEAAAIGAVYARDVREAGLPPEGRNFKPHVTLARLRGARADAVAAYLERQGGIAAEPFTVSRFVVYSSRNSVGGGPYVVEAAYPLED